MPRIVDRTGQRQGRLLIVRRDLSYSKKDPASSGVHAVLSFARKTHCHKSIESKCFGSPLTEKFTVAVVGVSPLDVRFRSMPSRLIGASM